MKNRTLVSIAVFLMITASLGARVVERVVARVNDLIITHTDLETEKSRLTRQAYQQFSGTELDSRLKEIEENALDNMVKELLLLERAKEMGIDEERVIAHYLEDFKEKNDIESEEKLSELLQQEGMTMEDLKMQIKKAVIPQIVIGREVTGQMEIKEREIEEYYEEHKNEYRLTPELTLENIFISKDDEEAREKAEKVSMELAKGTSVVDVLSFFNLNEDMARPRTYKSGDLLPELEEAASKLEPGEVTDPIDTEKGVYVLKLVERSDDVYTPLNEKKEEIVAVLKENRFGKSLDEYMEELKERYFVKIYHPA